jgi:hypothetical protein
MKAARKPLAFFSPDNLDSWRRAEKHAGPKGRVATMPDVIAARIATREKGWDAEAWSSYITTTSSEYVGTSSGGTKIIIVAHGNGPLSRYSDAEKVYQRGKDDRQTYRGSISREEFLKLESGGYGPVEIVSLDKFLDRHEYGFINSLDADTARAEHLFRARLGRDYEAYIEAHVEVDREFGKTQSKRDGGKGALPPLFSLGDPSDTHYALKALREMPRRYYDTLYASSGLGNRALAHLLVASGLHNMSLHEYRTRSVLYGEFGLHEGGGACRFLALPEGCRADFKTVDPRGILARHWRDLLVPAQGKKTRIRCIRENGDGWFTETLKSGHNMDTGVPEHPVRSLTKLGDGRFETKVEGYYGFLRYDLKEVAAIAPAEANAYTLGEAGIVDGTDAKVHFVEVTFYKADIDLKNRLLTQEEIEKDDDLLVKLSSD